MFSAEMGKRKDRILFLPYEMLSQCQALIFTDGTSGNTMPSVEYICHIQDDTCQTHGKGSNAWCSSRRTRGAAVSGMGAQQCPGSGGDLS